MTYQDYLNAGYKQKCPSLEAANIDMQVAQEIECDACGGECEYRPLMKGEIYKAFSICTVCGHEMEF